MKRQWYVAYRLIPDINGSETLCRVCTRFAKLHGFWDIYYKPLTHVEAHKLADFWRSTS